MSAESVLKRRGGVRDDGTWTERTMTALGNRDQGVGWLALGQPVHSDICFFLVLASCEYCLPFFIFFYYHPLFLCLRSWDGKVDGWDGFVSFYSLGSHSAQLFAPSEEALPGGPGRETTTTHVFHTVSCLSRVASWCLFSTRLGPACHTNGVHFCFRCCRFQFVTV
jgi:hypothetical protein